MMDRTGSHAADRRAGCRRKSFGGIVNVWRLSTSASRRFSKSNVTRNRPGFNMLWSTGPSSLGWARETIVIIDDDLGRSGAPSKDGLAFNGWWRKSVLATWGWFSGVEMSRLARSCRDWHQLLEICALFDTLIADCRWRV